MNAYVYLSKTQDALSSNTQPMPFGDAVAYALQASLDGRPAKVYRAAPVTPGVSGNDLLKIGESFLSDDLLAEFFPRADERSTDA